MSTHRNAKVKRYIPGKRPDFGVRSKGVSSDSSDHEEQVESGARSHISIKNEGKTAARDIFEAQVLESNFEAQVLESGGFDQVLKADSEEDESEEERRKHLLRSRAMEENESDQDSDHSFQEGNNASKETLQEIERQRLREKALQRLEESETREEKYATGKLVYDNVQDGSDSEESSTGESSSEEESYFGRTLLKPIFVKKSERKTVKDSSTLEAEEEAEYHRETELMEERAKLSKKMVKEALEREEIENEESNQTKTEKGESDIDTGSAEGSEDEAEFSLWIEREKARVKRDFEERFSKERAEEERKLAAETEQINYRKAIEDRGKKLEERKSTMDSRRFLQKYFHKGAFFMEGDEEVYQRDFSVATGDDLVRKENLPKVMQVKDFGKMSRSKYTHLKNEDTLKNSLWDEFSKERKSNQSQKNRKK